MQSIDGISSTSPAKNSPEQIRRVAREFESVFTSMMLRAMRKTVGDSGLIPDSLGEKIYTEMLDDEYAKMIGNGASLGLADLIVKELERSENRELGRLHDMGKAPWMIDNRFVPSGATSARSFDPEARVAQVRKWEDLIVEASETYRLDSSLVAAVIAQESGGNQYAVSRAGAKGLMQLMDSTARDLGVPQPFNARANVLGGTKYLRSMLDRFGGNERLALASYNAGPKAVERYRGIPPYRETQEYVESVLRMRQEFASRGIPQEK